MKSWLRDGFRYDLWANQRWLPLIKDLKAVGRPEYAVSFPSEPQARMDAIFSHLLWAQKTWLSRLSLPVVSDGDQWLAELHNGWSRAVEQFTTDEMITYRNTKGIEFVQPFGDIALHVINHGTYHRGQLREVAELAGFDWPDTDLVLWRNQTS